MYDPLLLEAEHGDDPVPDLRPPRGAADRLELGPLELEAIRERVTARPMPGEPSSN
jgi:hypothetical protein